MLGGCICTCMYMYKHTCMYVCTHMTAHKVCKDHVTISMIVPSPPKLWNPALCILTPLCSLPDNEIMLVNNTVSILRS